MTYLNILQLLLNLLSTFTERAANNDLLDAGQYKAIAEANKKGLDNVIKAKEAVYRARNDDELADKLRKKYGLDAAE